MTVITGMIPVAPTVFHADGALDLAGQRRTTDCLVDAGVDGICILANYSEQFSLADDEREAVVAATLEQTAGRVPIMVTTSHFSADIAAARVRSAAEQGAQLVMMMPPFFGATMRVDEDTVLEYFKRVVGDVAIDVMIQDAPLSTTPLSVGLFTRLAAEVPQIRYAKIEVPRAADKIRALIAAAGDTLPGVFDGEEGVTLLPDLRAGAIGSMASSAVPFELRAVVTASLAGDDRGAEAAWERVLPLIHHENRQCGLLAAKVLLAEGGVIGSEAVRFPLTPLNPHTRSQLVALARRLDAFVLKWAA